MVNSAEARVVASSVLVVSLLLGAWSSVERLLVLLVDHVEVGLLLLAVVPALATAVAVQATRAATESWARTLGSATVMLGVLCTLCGLVYFAVGS